MQLDRGTKARMLAEDGVLNSHPERVHDPKFCDQEFFDPIDLVQVKYEMLRRVLVDGISITDATLEYGVSRPTFYQAKASLDAAGLAGLVPKKRGPQGRRKLKEEIMTFLERHAVPGQPTRSKELAKLVQEHFGVDVHPRTIERALQEKKTARHRRG
jgi:transposase